MAKHKVDHLRVAYERMLSYDKIWFPTLEDVKKVLGWGEANMSNIFADWNPPLTMGHIDVPDPNGVTDAYIVFDQNSLRDRDIEMMEFDYTGQLHWLGTLDMMKSTSDHMWMKGSISEPTSVKRFGKEFIQRRMEASVQLYIAVMGYIRANRDTYVTTMSDTVIDKVQRRTSDTPSNRTHTPSGDNIVKIQPRTIYRVAGPSATQSQPSGSTRVYHAESWTVIGHKRRFRNDKGEVIKEVDVQPYTKGKGQHKPKTYQV